MRLSVWFFPCRCPFCGKVIYEHEISCTDCRTYAETAPSILELPQGFKCAAAFWHNGVHRDAVLKYKYSEYKQLYIQFSLILHNVISKCYGDIKFDYYTSVPPHKRNLSNRTFDQVKLIAKETAKLDNVQYTPLLRQIKESQSQHSLSREERIENIKGIYQYLAEIDITDKTILIFDDVVTTGSTLSECAKVLKNNGAANVFCIAINR